MLTHLSGYTSTLLLLFLCLAYCIAKTRLYQIILLGIFGELIILKECTIIYLIDLVNLYNFVMQVYYFDGSLECFGAGHIQYGVIAVIVSVLFLIPLPIYVLAVSRNWLKVRRVICNISTSAGQYRFFLCHMSITECTNIGKNAY